MNIYKTYYIKWGFESRLKLRGLNGVPCIYYIKWGFESRLKHSIWCIVEGGIISNGDLKVG